MKATFFDRYGATQEKAEGETAVENTVFNDALLAVQGCTRHMRPDKSVPNCAPYRTRHLHEALGYPEGDPSIVLQSVEDFTPGIQYIPGYKGQPRLTYTPASRDFDTGVHVAGMTEMIAGAPLVALGTYERAVLIANVVSGFSSALYAPIYGTRLAPPTIGKGTAISAARKELIAQAKAAQNVQSKNYYEDLLRQVSHETGYNFRIITKGLAGLAVAYALLGRE